MEMKLVAVVFDANPFRAASSSAEHPGVFAVAKSS